MTRNAEGYTSIRQQSDQIAVALRETALLIGPLRNQPIELEPGGSVMPGLGLESDAATLLRRARDLREGIFKVIVYGEFKHGKSTLLNALLGSRILAAKTLKCTAIISVLVYGERPDVAIYTVGQEQPAFLSREEYVKQFQLTAADEETLSDKGFVDRFKEIDYAQLECQSSLCANGVRLVDSPGLGDHPSRTRVTTRYLRESHAIILMLNAMRLLSDDEKRFIETEFKPGRTHNVFFVVNRINQINQREVSEVQHYFRTFLTPYFTRNDGQFDEDLYQRRVFFINALGALEARLQPGCTNGMSELSSPAAPDPTGVLALEQELERFLTSDEKHTTALQESIGFLQSAIGEALRQIEQQKMLQDVPLHQFEQSITDAEEHLVKLSRRQQDIERTIRLFGDTIAQKLIAHLREYLDQMHATWPQDAQSLKLDAISLRNIIQGFMEGLSIKSRSASASKNRFGANWNTMSKPSSVAGPIATPQP
ncbi:MAG: hypothetical protein HC837_03985 [Chloroflexaceae bacterium]|nr:hypothetical protein [Chloroflexaceae bacterium]